MSNVYLTPLILENRIIQNDLQFMFRRRLKKISYKHDHIEKKVAFAVAIDRSSASIMINIYQQVPKSVAKPTKFLV